MDSKDFSHASVKYVQPFTDQIFGVSTKRKMNTAKIGKVKTNIML